MRLTLVRDYLSPHMNKPFELRLLSRTKTSDIIDKKIIPGFFDKIMFSQIPRQHLSPRNYLGILTSASINLRIALRDREVKAIKKIIKAQNSLLRNIKTIEAICNDMFLLSTIKISSQIAFIVLAAGEKLYLTCVVTKAIIVMTFTRRLSKWNYH